MPKAPFFSRCHSATAGCRARRILRAKTLASFCLAILLITLNANAAWAASVKGLVGYWPFQEGMGAVTRDFSGNDNSGSLVNGPAWSVGKLGYGLSFNGVDQYVEIPHSDSLNITKELTVSTWIYNKGSADSGLVD